jgi:UDP-N-acetylmuramate: L-alanyl-gamma-D-glutamyl-meso-diaminopimelate ligase
LRNCNGFTCRHASGARPFGHRLRSKRLPANVYDAHDLGIAVHQGFHAAHLSPTPDCVIVGNAIPRGNPEVEEALNRKLLYRSQAEVVKEEFIRGKHCLAVAGTHGKTTTTSIASWVMDQGGLDPGFLIGGYCAKLWFEFSRY